MKKITWEVINMKWEVLYRLPDQVIEVEAEDEVDLDEKIPYAFDGLEVIINSDMANQNDEIEVIGIREKE